MKICNCSFRKSEPSIQYKFTPDGDKKCLMCDGVINDEEVRPDNDTSETTSLNDSQFCTCGDAIRRQYGTIPNEKLLRCKYCSKVRRSRERKGGVELSTKILTNSSLETSANNDDVVKAIDRTTHAVRAFVLFLFYQLTALTAALGTYGLARFIGNRNSECSEQLRAYGACSPNSFLLVVAFFIWVFGVIYSSNVGWSEIKKSAIPGS